jgi:hypothetical protein
MAELASNGTPLDVLTEGDWETPYGLVKFGTIAEEKLYDWTMVQGHQEETGGGEFPWSARFDADDKIPALKAGVIISVDTRGGVTSQRCDTAEELAAAWKDHEDAYAAWVHGECPDGAGCDGEAGCLDRW